MQAINAAIAESDGVLIVTPEYNHGVPGVLKNALDWASRPIFNSVLKRKPVSIISSSLAFTGGVRAQYQLRETLIAMQAYVVPGPEVVVGGVHSKFKDETFLDESTLNSLAVRDADLPESDARYRRSGGEILPVCKREYRQPRLGHSSVLCGYAVSSQKTRTELATSLSLE